MKKTVNLGDREITIVGTAHVSEQSVKEVRETIREINPDFVGVELDEDRLESLRNRDGWRGLNIGEAVKDGRGPMLALNLLMSIYQRRIGLEQGVTPGSEMLEAVEAAEEEGIEFDTIDKDISETLESLRKELGLFDKSLLLSSILFEKTDIEVEELKESDMLSEIVDELEEELPALKKVMLDDRNRYMAERIREKDFERAVVFVGAAHVEGLVDELENPTEELSGEEKGLAVPWMELFKYGLPVFIISMLAYSFFKIGFTTGVEATSFWILSNGILAMLGAMLARSHPFTWITSFVAAPLTSLDPALGAGMVASYVEAKFYPPTVQEMEDIVYLENYSELWDNQAGRILLTLVFVTIGSLIASLASAGFILSLISGL